FEDTAFYQYNVLLSLNEVGSHPAPFPPDPVGMFHEHNRRIAATRPETMTATSTHDTKRSGDVRARISALSEVPERWAEVVESWHVVNRRHRGSAEVGAVPTRSEELFIYQTLIGSWPLDADLTGYAGRVCEHLVKAAREAKVHTAWLEPDPVHEEALTDFARGLIEDAEFVEELTRFAEPLWRAGAVNSLAQLTLRLAAPGVPDIYQGCESWSLSLTDPDNRRPVDWKPLAKALDEPVDPESWRDGRIKLLVTSRMLHLHPRGEYLPLSVEGDRADHVVSFARHDGERWVLVAVPRLVVGLTGEDEWWPRSGWNSTAVVLPEGGPTRWRSVFGDTEPRTNGVLELGPLFSAFPVAALTSP
ncbi:MAG TPA: hypothetical protein VE173_06585, partial [Longimicrobiales bacterium]|nr:hypothetical protein [Longimicrobiales bacterium]